MKKLDINTKQEYYGGIAATAIFSIISLAITGISLVSSIVSGALNIANASKLKNKKELEQKKLEFNQHYDPNTYVNVI